MDTETDWRRLIGLTDPDRWRTVARFPARFNSTCDDCGEPTYEGEDLVMQVRGEDEDEKRVLHDDCEPWR